jgi:hypothetical protein
LSGSCPRERGYGPTGHTWATPSCRFRDNRILVACTTSSSSVPARRAACSPHG